MNQTRNGVILVGTQWGDEGKGKIVDSILTPGSACVRFQGGPNAGHTLYVDGKKIVLHMLPSGAITPGIKNFIAAGCVLDPKGLLEEVQSLPNKIDLLVDLNCHVILDTYKVEEATSGIKAKIGTTGRGIGPTYAHKIERSGVRVRDVLLENPYFEQLHELGVRFGDVSAAVNSHDGLVLFEGAQGTLLDVDHGTYPFVTSSNTIAGAACVSAGFGPTRIKEVIGVVKAYSTRVGEGPFPTEDTGPEGEKLRQIGNEFGSTTGRPRRCGWLDIPLLKEAFRVSGVTSFFLTKIDVLSSFEKIPVHVTTKWYGHPARGLVKFDGWNEEVTQIRTKEEMPTKMVHYIQYIENELGVPCRGVSVGPLKEQLIMLPNR